MNLLSTKDSSESIWDCAGSLNLSGRQAKASGRISSAILEMNRAVQENAANAEESSSASEQLYSQIRDMEDVMSRLMNLVQSVSEPG